MMSKALIGITVLVVAVLAVFYVGNQVVQTTPLSSADGPFQYEIMDPPLECLQQAMEASKSITDLGQRLIAEQRAQSDCVVQKLNEKGALGWELVLVRETQPIPTYIFKKR
ncbi:MAG: hypothetical protein G01um10148_986 [Parcubacteria group bacterium Gr01-1014_8]|nr:MAG: hypothetical protein G01um10148_986 [Parcubacteria group bacterium Gr01-1014_8]